MPTDSKIWRVAYDPEAKLTCAARNVWANSPDFKISWEYVIRWDAPDGAWYELTSKGIALAVAIDGLFSMRDAAVASRGKPAADRQYHGLEMLSPAELLAPVVAGRALIKDLYAALTQGISHPEAQALLTADYEAWQAAGFPGLTQPTDPIPTEPVTQPVVAVPVAPEPPVPVAPEPPVPAGSPDVPVAPPV